MGVRGCRSWDCGISDVDPERSGRPWRWCHLVAGHRPVRCPDGGYSDPGFDPARVQRLAGGAVAPADLVAGRGLGIDLAVSGQPARRVAVATSLPDDVVRLVLAALRSGACMATGHVESLGAQVAHRHATLSPCWPA